MVGFDGGSLGAHRPNGRNPGGKGVASGDVGGRGLFAPSAAFHLLALLVSSTRY